MDIDKIINIIRESKKAAKCPPGYKYNKKTKSCVPKRGKGIVLGYFGKYDHDHDNDENGKKKNGKNGNGSNGNGSNGNGGSGNSSNGSSGNGSAGGSTGGGGE